LDFKYKTYWRKTGLKGNWGNIFLNLVAKHKPKNFLEIGVFCGVTSINVCNLLNYLNKGKFTYTGVDLFGGEKKFEIDEMEPKFLKNQKFSNPLKNIYYNLILRENLNSIQSVSNLLKKYKKNINLIKGDTNKVLKGLNLSNMDCVFIDGGHSYNTVKNDLNILYDSLKGKEKILICDDYGGLTYIPEVKKAIDDFVDLNKLRLNVIKDRFAEIIT
tara:strand:- start:165 stop:812 length:648 start_codon:yes stop_codon:yes gene_type:complete